MLFNEKIDYLIKLGMKLNSNFEKDFKEQMRKIPVLVKHKLRETQNFGFKSLTKGLSFEINAVCDDIVTDFDLDIKKLYVLNFKESDLCLHVELPDKEKIKTLTINNLEDVIGANIDPYHIIIFEFSNPALNKEYVENFEAENVNKLYMFDFVKTKNSYYLICDESVEDLEQEMFISNTVYKLTDEDMKVLVVDENKELISD